MKVKVGTQNLRILTAKESINPFSERFWIKRMKRIAENIKSVNLDIIAIQESIGYLQMLVLKLYLGWWKYKFISTRQGLTPSRVGIFYKKEFKLNTKDSFTLSKAESFKKHKRVALKGWFHLPGEEAVFAVTSVHLSHYSEKALQEGLNALNVRFSNIIMGDFNWTEDKINLPTYYKTDKNVKKTYISFTEGYAGKVIDFIYSADCHKMNSTKTLGDNLASDHLLVHSEIMI